MEVSSTTPFAALTLRSLTNERSDFLLATFPLADFNQDAPFPMVFLQFVDGGGYQTQYVFLNTGNAATDVTLVHFDDSGNVIHLVPQ